MILLPCESRSSIIYTGSFKIYQSGELGGAPGLSKPLGRIAQSAETSSGVELDAAPTSALLAGQLSSLPVVLSFLLFSFSFSFSS
jgi:hypothetical protein